MRARSATSAQSGLRSITQLFKEAAPRAALAAASRRTARGASPMVDGRAAAERPLPVPASLPQITQICADYFSREDVAVR